MRTSMFVVWVAALALTACGDDENNGKNGGNSSAGGSCSLEMELSGEVEKTISWGDAEGCGGAASGSLLTLTFGALLEDEGVILRPDGTAGETGMATTTVSIIEGEAEWTARDCTLEFTRNEVVESDPDFGDTYALEGNGSCADPATPDTPSAMGEVTVGEFSFATESPWGE